MSAINPLHQEIAKLRAQVDDLQTQLKERDKAEQPLPFPLDWRLTRTESDILSRLVRHDYCSLELLGSALRYSQSPTETVRVHVMHIRRKLAPHGIDIECIWGRGFRLTPSSIARIKSCQS